MLNLYNTLTRKKEVFKPLKGRKVGLYTCGPTVYSYAHIGNLRTYVFEDILKRTLLFNDYQVNHLMNITDVGHLTSDADTGEDKIEKTAKKEKKSAYQIAEFYTQAFFKDCEKLNILPPNIIAPATEYIEENISLIQVLEKKGYTYKTKDGIYFDTSKFKDYGKLTNMDFDKLNKTLKAGARIELSPEKKNITDFSLWKFSSPDEKRQMEWPSPWGTGFPGWHIECAVINLKYLGNAFKNKTFVPEQAETIDIHAGGSDLIPIHHTNEIAQVEAATGKKFVNYWLHGEFLILKDLRMGKSTGNVILIDDLEEKGYSPLSYRYLVLNAHYRKPLEFSWQALNNAQQGLNDISNFIYHCLLKAKPNSSIKLSPALIDIQKEFKKAINDDLNTPQALAVFWKLIKKYYKEKLDPRQTYQLALIFDTILGLGLDKIKVFPLPKEIQLLNEKREKMRKSAKWAEADKIRKEIEALGYFINDTKEGTIIQPKNKI